MLQTYFLGANSHQGFFSLYGGFAADRGDFLHIIKGGPGTGKSGFMKRLAERAEEKGLCCRRVLCSGDPDSLDAVYIPELRTGWVDGTAPHICEPSAFGVSGNYVNLGAFCRPVSDESSKSRILKLNRQYKEQYRQAYAALAAAEKLRMGSVPELWTEENLLRAKKRVMGILHRWGQQAAQGEKRTEHCFASAISCRGRLFLREEINELCKLKYVLENDWLGADMLLEYAAKQAEEMGLETLCFHSPLNPARLEGLILPQTGLGIFNQDWDEDNCRHIRLDELVSSGTDKQQRRQIRRSQRLSRDCIELAVERLEQAKQLHDELEACYRPYMDFDALTDFTEKEMERVFA